jgi:tRNA1(Val) A37 N6-methylase TrmN6
MSCDHLLNGRIILHQRLKGHRAGTDAVLLAAACPPLKQGMIIDLGSASGAVGLIAAHHNTQAHVMLVDRDTDALSLAHKNIEANGFESRMHVLHVDIFAPASDVEAQGLKEQSADIVLTNPPFFEEGQGRQSPDHDKRNAHHMIKGGLKQWIKTACRILKPHGHIVVIHRADALLALLDTLNGRFGALVVTPVYPRDGDNASRVLVCGIKGSRAPLTIATPLILHTPDGHFTDVAARLHGGHVD